MNIKVTHGIDKLDRQARRVPKKAATGLANSARKRAQEGNRLARRIATRSAGEHGKQYPRSFLAEAIGPFIWEYGPHPSLSQGEMSFEYGSKNQRPHLDLNKSADVVGPKLAKDVEKLAERLFW